jgi:hypothetical protein
MEIRGKTGISDCMMGTPDDRSNELPEFVGEQAYSTIRVNS